MVYSKGQAYILEVLDWPMKESCIKMSKSNKAFVRNILDNVSAQRNVFDRSNPRNPQLSYGRLSLLPTGKLITKEVSFTDHCCSQVDKWVNREDSNGGPLLKPSS